MDGVKESLPRAWSAFFSAHGNFTEVQRRAIPVVLEGFDAMVVAATASGKTEAAVAPLLERHTTGGGRSAGLSVLYICPTRALVRDLYERLSPPLTRMRVSLGRKSGDTAPVSRENPPTVLVTTPESVDSLLTRVPRLFCTLQAVVLDEIHLFDGTPRGDHLRCLLTRIEAVRSYAGLPHPCQRVALSATVAEPLEVGGRYLNRPVVVEVEGGRELEVSLEPLTDLSDLTTALAERVQPKTLLFCNTRAEVEEVAAFLRAELPFEAAVFVHYSNLDPALRREVEKGFAEARVALGVCTSTLELGIDIGSIDEVLLLGPPPNPASLLQRIGRGGRRKGHTQVRCFFRTPREALRFDALLSMATRGVSKGHPDPAYAFKPSVLIQQTFSLLKQSPTGGVRAADLRRLAPAEVGNEALRGILEHLTLLGFLRKGRPGEWRSGLELGELADEHEIYSNISSEPLGASIVDAYSGRPIAKAERPRTRGETLLMGGKSVTVAWRDRYIYGVQGQNAPVDETMKFRTTPFAVPVGVCQEAARRLGLAPGEMPFLPDGMGEGGVLFHFLGDVYGRWLAALLDFAFGGLGEASGDEGDGAATPHNELSLHLRLPLEGLPPWDAAGAEEALRSITPDIRASLELGRFHPLLPPELAQRAVLETCDLAGFERLYRQARFVTPTPELRRQLNEFL